MARKFVRGAAACAAAAALSFGATGVASAAEGPLGSLSALGGGGSSLGSLGGASDLAVPTGTKVRLGNVGGPAWNVDVYSQIHGASTVAPGAEVKVRVEIVGASNNETAINEVIDWMPAGFTLSKVETLKAGLLGTSPATLNQGEYSVVTEGDRQVARVSLQEGLIFKQAVKVSPSKPLIVDFTWKAPQEEGTHKTGAGAKVGALINSNKVFDNGPEVTVAKGASSGGAAGSLDFGSLTSVLGS